MHPLEGAHRIALPMTADDQFGKHKRQADRQYREDVYQNESAATIDTGNVRKFPDIPEAMTVGSDEKNAVE